KPRPPCPVGFRLLSGILERDVSVELPFVLMHPKPIDPPMSRPQSAVPDLDPPIDTNLIEFETNSSSITQDDDFVFEDFARLRLKGLVDDKDEDC
ncbi:hypothetical protein CRUP_020014, partial [Coryphaenoides rupestris]